MATPSEELIARLLEVASGPASVSGDAGSVQQHSLRDLLEALKHVENQTAATSSPARGMRITKLVPPGAV